ncbi:SGNH/GDSL hydrolase family protein [Halobacillus sp. Marseille-Q1614]|uniref:SGNH/GDSL hydrolase family protein n=1 Tax=Halobacillus sp. Marseille-Q1614 TaxID=2709134 RepID=UPI00352FF351
MVSKIILIGDSITDSHRGTDSEDLGDGYVRLLRDYYITFFPEKELDFVNKGVSANRITDLKQRWQRDVIDVKPDWVSISIGINDVWRQLDNPEINQVDPDQFLSIYKKLLKQVADETDSQIILMQPTVIEEDADSKGNQLLKDYVEIVDKLAKDYQAILVPTHEAFITQIEKNSSVPLTTDGVHMTSTGNMLMARTWIEAVKEAITH